MEQIELNLSGLRHPRRAGTAGHPRRAGFPPYYGMNLDALFDMLTTESRPLRLVVCYPADPCEALRAYWPRAAAGV